MFAAIDNWLFLLLLAMAAIFRLLTKAAGSRTSSSETDQSTFPRPDKREQTNRPTSDEEQIRKFLEALGQHRTAKPPTPITPQAKGPPGPVSPITPPAGPVPRRSLIGRRPEQPEKPATIPPPLPRRYAPKRPIPAAASAAEFEVQ